MPASRSLAPGGGCSPWWLILLLLADGSLSASEPAPRLSLHRTGPRVELAWPGTLARPDGSEVRPWFEIQVSTDLVTWQPLGERVRALGAEPVITTVPSDLPNAYYRVVGARETPAAPPGDGGAEVFGYAASFQEALTRLGQISAAEFARLHPSGADYLPALSWDPTTATFWDAFNADPAVVNQGKPWGSPGYRSVDYRLNPAELAIFRRNGFVVSERLGLAGHIWTNPASTVGGVFYQLWYNDLPVFISTDAILHAWHRTYGLMLEEIEEVFLHQAVSDLLEAMATRIPDLAAAAGGGVLRESVLDADYLITVARSLLASGRSVPSVLGQDARVAATLADISRGQLKSIPDFMGHCRVVDFSHFTVRGHYTRSPLLGAYFQCVMWLGRIDLPVAGGPFERCPGERRFASPRELGTAIVLHQLIRDSGATGTWETMNRVIDSFVGWSDSLNVPQLGGVLAGAGIRSLADIPDLASLERIQAAIAQGDLGVQNIRSDAFFTPLNDGTPVRLPRAFLVMGQRFVPDSWALSQTVFDAIQWEQNGVELDVLRKVPSALDVAFGVLGNNQVVPLLVDRIERPSPARPPTHADVFRDGLPYQHNLAAVRSVMDAQKAEAWDSSIVMGWLGALRELSAPTTDATYPEAMRTRDWAMRTLNTQLASWTQYRHDTILYAKQSYTGVPVCFYPAGFVEPRPEFWRRLQSVVARAADLVESLEYPGKVAPFPWVPPAVVQSNQVTHLRRFAATVGTLARMSDKELRQQPFTDDEELFIRNLMQDVGWAPFGSGSTPRYSGWYPTLFYQPIRHTDLVPASDPMASSWPSRREYFHDLFGVAADDRLVADVHTDPPSPEDPGSVLHQGVGNVALLMVAVDNGPDRMVYAGPVLTHYEFEILGPPLRLTDNDWMTLRWRPPPQPIEGYEPPPWTRRYFVPSP